MRVTESIGPAWETMKRLLFRPLEVGKWFAFGFMFFLQTCAEGGGGGNIPNTNGLGNMGKGGHTGGTHNAISGAFGNVVSAFSGGHSSDGLSPGLMIGIGIGVLVAMVPLFLLFFWLGSRGQAMSIRAVALGNSDVGNNWNATQPTGGRLLKFHLVVTAITLVVLLPMVGIGAAVVMPAMDRGEGFDSFGPIVLGLAAIAVVFVIPLTLVSSLGRNFVAPIMLKHEIGARDGWKRFWAVGKDHVGGLFVFYLLKIMFSIGAGIVSVVVSVLTCCLGFLPVVNQTLMAPWHFFERAWTLEILASMSPDFDLRGGMAPPAPPVAPQGGWGPPGGYGPQGGPQGGYNPYAPPGGGYGGPPPGGYGGPT